MERTRGGYIPRGESGWKSLLVFVGGVMWALSMAGQIVWDVIVLLSPKQDYGELLDPDASLSASECMHQVMRGLSLPSGCNTLVDPVARIALLLGVLSLWWNPRLQDRLGRPGGKIVGVAEYYKLQAILLLARCLGWIYLAGTANAEHDSQTTKGIHAALLFFGILVSHSQRVQALVLTRISRLSCHSARSALTTAPKLSFRTAPNP